jgi:adenylate cyclase
VRGAQDAVETPEPLRLGRFGLRFEDAVVEADYRRWQTREAVPFSRFGMIASAVGWGIAYVASAYAIPGAAVSMAPWIFGAITPVLALGYLATYRPDRYMLPVTAFANLVAGWVAVWLAFHVIDRVDASSLSSVVIAFFGFTIFRLRPSLAVFIVGSYLAWHQALLLHSALVGGLESREAWVNSVMPWVAFSTGLITCCVLSRVNHDAYRRELIIDEQGRTIQAERERSERLLRNALPDSVVDRLKMSDEVIADHIDELSVLFVDIVGFTPLAATMTPPQLVRLLNDVFTVLDELTYARELEKVKTIGDAYMVVAGAPVPRTNHAEAIADLALDIRGRLAELGERTGYPLSYRIGISSGSAVAGVIGRRRFAYDLWGHTVNMAARMESHGVSGRIQVTCETADLLAASHRLERRGEIEIKGVGTTTTWFLEERLDGDVVRASRGKSAEATV